MSYAIGIDLGTTHSALSWINADAQTGRGAGQAVLPVPQLTQPGTVEPRQLLPSVLYLAAENEFPPGSLTLPWKNVPLQVSGEFARSHGAKVPTRVVSSAKSWLTHPTVDRRAAILPWQAPAEVPKISPVDASARFLEHLRLAWDHQFGAASLAQQQVVLTVPASFDAAARDLTLEAASKAGLGAVTLLEEPQAALYAWLEAKGAGWRQALHAGDVVLVIDVGGGTSDFSLIGVSGQGGDLQLERLAVGDHILLGGDNMDLALAFALQQKLTSAGKPALDPWQFNALTQACRVAKEQLFTDPSKDRWPVTIAGRGSALIGGTLKTELTRAELTQLLVDGFFPQASIGEGPAPSRRSGLGQLGLPYAADAGITRHLAAFLSRQASSLKLATAFARPTAVLFNGGVFKAPALEARVIEVLNGWLAADGAPAARVLDGADLDLAVARGAAYYGWVKAGHGLRIRGGTARSYYVGVESSMPAVPGFVPPVKALCVAPFGMEEGTHADLPPQEFGLVVGEPTRFRFFSSSTRRADVVGTMLDDAERAEGLDELAAIETTLSGAAGALVPVNLQAAVTELGALELRCVERGGKGAWKLELNVRGG